MKKQVEDLETGMKDKEQTLHMRVVQIKQLQNDLVKSNKISDMAIEKHNLKQMKLEAELKELKDFKDKVKGLL